MLLASDLNECIFSYLFAEELCNCFATCTLWLASKDSKSTSVLIWFNLYRHLVELPKLLPHTEDFPWHQKVTDLYSFVSGASPFTLTDARPDSGKPQKAATISAGSVQPIRLVCRSGHTASLFYIDKREVVVFFGGATHFYTFVNSYDILSVDNGVPLRTYSAVKGDVPTARWLHRACSFENNRKVVIFGGQVNDGAFSDEVFLFTLVETPAEEPVGGFNSTLSLESVIVPNIDGNNRNRPQPRGGHSFVYDKQNDRFIAFGGLTSGNDVEVCVNDTYQLTLEKESSGSGNGSGSAGSLVAVWKKLRCSGSLPSPRWCHSGVLQGDDMFVFGGWSYERTEGAGSGSKFFNDVHILNITTLVWTQVDTSGSAPRPRCQCACFLFEKKAIASERKAICDSDDNDEAENDMKSMLKSRNLIESDTSAIVKYAEQHTTLHSDLPFDSTVPTSGYISRIRDREGLPNHDVNVIGHNESHITKSDINAELSPDLYLSNEMQSLSHIKCDGSVQGEESDGAWQDDEEVSGSSQFQGVKVSSSDDSVGGTTSMTLSLSLPTSIASSSLSGTPKYSKASRGYMVIYGGSCHNQENEGANVVHGSLVVDFHDFKILDLDTMVWLPVFCSYPRCRGGIHAIVETKKGWLLSGGMQTEGVSGISRFKNDTTFIQPNIGVRLEGTSTWRPSAESESKSDFEFRLKNKFLSVKA